MRTKHAVKNHTNQTAKLSNRLAVVASLLTFACTPMLAQADYTMTPDGKYVPGNSYTMTPDGKYVGGNSYNMAPNGSYVSGSQSTMTPNTLVILYKPLARLGDKFYNKPILLTN